MEEGLMKGIKVTLKVFLFAAIGIVVMFFSVFGIYDVYLGDVEGTGFVYQRYPGMYEEGYRVNENGDNAREVFRALAEKHNGAVWDLFAIMGGLESMAKWEQEELAKKDKIHFTNKGYALLGDLFFNALMRLDIERE
jgi:hypothetical protein